MITKGTVLEQADMIEAYCVKNNVDCIYLDLRGYNALSATKKATVDTYYDAIFGDADDYVLEAMQSNEIYNVISFPSGDLASTSAGGWFPKKSKCPDDDHFINCYVIDSKGNITWQNAESPPKKSS
tara:strand:+ start:4101 stop:4478 length:378 start_codon:yes stop_codon:yes gene_type:complete